MVWGSALALPAGLALEVAMVAPVAWAVAVAAMTMMAMAAVTAGKLPEHKSYTKTVT
jgi:hypothetical protein